MYVNQLLPYWSKKLSHIFLSVRNNVRSLCFKNNRGFFPNLIDSDVAKDDLIRKIRHPVWPDGGHRQKTDSNDYAWPR